MIRVRATVKQIDRGWDKLRSLLKQMKKSYVKVGVFGEGEPRDDHQSNVALALIHEFGSPAANIPERSFLRSTIDLNKATYMGILKAKLLPSVLENQLSFLAALDRLGAKAAADVKSRIRNNEIRPPDAYETIQRKRAKGRSTGEPVTLVDTGQLLNSITWQVVGQNGESDK